MWIGSGVGSTVIASAVVSLVSTLSAGALLLRPFTILRTRMEIEHFSDQQAGDENPFGTYAKLVVTETAAALGITALPDPSGISGDPEASWFVWQALFSRVNVDSASGQHFNEYKWTVDSQAMRKVGPDDDIVSLYSNETSHGTTLITNGRMLIQLH